MVRVITVVTGDLEENAYIVFQEGREDAVVIDPGDDAPMIVRALEANELAPALILLTHGHFDHTGAVNELKRKYGIKAAVHASDEWRLHETGGVKALFSDGKDMIVEAERLLHDGDKIDEAGMEFTVMHTPGHTAGSVCFLIEDMIFTGDTLFAGTVGRTDFPDSSWPQMKESLAKLNALEGEWTVYPGHGPATSLVQERFDNPYLTGGGDEDVL